MTDRALRTRALLLVAPGVVWLLAFSVLPLALLAVMSLWTSSIFGLSTNLTLDNYRTVLSEPVYARVLLHTLRIAAITTILSLVISYPMAYFLATLKGTAKTVCLLLLFMPLVMDVLAPGFERGSPRYALAVELCRITFPYLTLVSITALQGGVVRDGNVAQGDLRRVAEDVDAAAGRLNAAEIGRAHV